jgi:hypothetical protein
VASLVELLIVAALYPQPPSSLVFGLVLLLLLANLYSCLYDGAHGGRLATSEYIMEGRALLLPDLAVYKVEQLLPHYLVLLICWLLQFV